MNKPFYKISLKGYYKLLRYYINLFLADTSLYLLKKWGRI